MQSFTDFEVVVLDAGSTEPVVDYVRAITADDPRFRVHASPRRLTAPQARNAAATLARAPMIALLDSDDLMPVRRLEQHVNALTENPDLVMVGGALRVIGGAGLDRQTPKQRAALPPTNDRPITAAAVRWSMPFSAPTLASALTMRTDALHAVGGYDENITQCDDYSLMWRMSEYGDFPMLPDLAAYYRLHGHQITFDHRGPQHREYMNLRSTIMSARVGHPVPLAEVITATSSFAGSEQIKASAIALVDELLERFVSDHDLSDDDLAWVHADHQRRISTIRALTIGKAAPQPDDERLATL